MRTLLVFYKFMEIQKIGVFRGVVFWALINPALQRYIVTPLPTPWFIYTFSNPLPLHACYMRYAAPLRHISINPLKTSSVRVNPTFFRALTLQTALHRYTGPKHALSRWSKKTKRVTKFCYTEPAERYTVTPNPQPPPTASTSPSEPLQTPIISIIL